MIFHQLFQLFRLSCFVVKMSAGGVAQTPVFMQNHFPADRLSIRVQRWLSA
jgi:hypothetical protein